MDHFGIGMAFLTMGRVYSQSARRTGRTTSLVESVKDGDRVVCATVQEMRHTVDRIRERGVKVEIIVVDPKDPKALFDRPTSEGRTIFDHGWVEAFYQHVIENAAAHLDLLERESSGYGAAHRETRRRAEEIARWRR